MPPYVALAIVSMQHALGDAFQLLTPRCLPEWIGTDYLARDWCFEPLVFEMDHGIRRIVAKSDFIRMAFVHRHGGAWIDADTLLLRDPTASLFPHGLSAKLHWAGEALFGSQPGNLLLDQAIAEMAHRPAHRWGDPGGIRASVAAEPQSVVPIPARCFDPGYRPFYNFTTCDVMMRRDLDVSAFLVSPGTDVLKLYNTYFTRTRSSLPTVAHFLDEGSLLARLFLHIEPERAFWTERAEALIAQCAA
ncbi:glycosyltransferase [Paraburkholderia caribensis]|uniref:glycosyltransferase n=1 Tax=Paraburkholderia caribensis TaxID=75105 RepID=UPI001CC3D9C3|nr:glycosyltransferase [Paraburkholderia caribensis]